MNSTPLYNRPPKDITLESLWHLVANVLEGIAELRALIEDDDFVDDDYLPFEDDQATDLDE